MSSDSGLLGNPELRALLDGDLETQEAPAKAQQAQQDPNEPPKDLEPPRDLNMVGPILNPKSLCKKRPASAETAALPEPKPPARFRKLRKTPSDPGKPAAPQAKEVKPSGKRSASEYRRVYSKAYYDAMKQFKDLDLDARKAKAREAGQAAVAVT